MPLPSQMSPNVRRRANMYRRRRTRRRPVLMTFCVIALLSLIVWWLLPDNQVTNAPEPAQSLGQLPLESESQASNAGASRDEARSASDIIDPTQHLVVTQSNKSASTPPIVMGSGETNQPTRPATRIENPGTVTPRPSNPEKTPTASNLRTSPPNPARRSTPRPGSASARVQQFLQQGWDLLASNQLIEAREILSAVLQSQYLSEAEKSQIRASLTELNDRMVFSPEIVEGDHFVMSYVIQGGDVLSSIVKRFSLQVDWRFIQRINNISNPSRIRAGQRIKLITGPFHAVINKEAYRMDLYLGDDESRVYVKSYPVGLGEHNSTPEGMFRIRRDSKLIDPQWTDPRTGQVFSSDNPANPIGERWLGLQGIEERTRDMTSYGIHGTISPQSIGRQDSMGCVRLHANNVEVIYEVLMESVSLVEIRSR